MGVIDILTIIGYTITVFSFGYALGKDCCKNGNDRQEPCKL